MSANFWKGSQCDRWMFEAAQVKLAKDKRGDAYLSPDQLACLEIFFADVILAIGKHLDLRQQVVATALMYFKRFYIKNSWASVKPFLMALTCMYLAAKVEESGPIHAKSVRDAGKQVAPMAVFKGLLPTTFETEDIIKCEFFVVQAMGCCLVVFHPYRSLVEYANDAGIAQTVLPLAWNVVNDSNKSDLCFSQPPYLIALAALQIASSVVKEPKFPMWLAELSVSTSEVMVVVQALLDFYATLAEYNRDHEDTLKAAFVAVEARAKELDAEIDAAESEVASTACAESPALL